MSVFSKLYENTVKTIQTEQQIHFDKTEYFISTLFKSTIISSFEYENIPQFIQNEPDYIEECFYNNGIVAFFEITDEIKRQKSALNYIIPDDIENGYYITPAFATGKLLYNGLYSHYTLIFPNGKMCRLPIEMIEIAFNVVDGLPSSIICDELKDKCAKALNAVDTSLERATIANLIYSKDEQLTKSLLDVINDKDKLIKIANGTYSSKDIEKIPLYDDRETTILNLWDIFVRYKNLFFSTFGINNVEIAKAERLTQAEGSSNTEIVRYTLFDNMYKHRKDFCDRIKKHFNYEMKVHINRNIDTVTELNLTEQEKIDMKNKMISPYEDMTVTKNGDKSEPEKDENKGGDKE